MLLIRSESRKEARTATRESSGEKRGYQSEGEEKGPGRQQSAKMSWQPYIDDHMMMELPSGNRLHSAAIIGHEGHVWAQSSEFPEVTFWLSVISFSVRLSILSGMCNAVVDIMLSEICGEMQRFSRLDCETGLGGTSE